MENKLGDLESIFRAVQEPSSASRPITWWHWMNGNVNQVGIKKDIAWMKSIGLGGVQMFEGGLGTPVAIEDRLEHGSPAWRETVQYAQKLAIDAGLEFGIATSAGWSALGAPWVEPESAMKKVVWSITQINSDQKTIRLQPLPKIAGNYQDCGNWGDQETLEFSRDTFVIAIPDEDFLDVLIPLKVLASREFSGSEIALFDQKFAEGIIFEREVNSPDQFWIDFEYGTPTYVGSVSVGLPGPKGFGAPLTPLASLWMSNDGRNYEKIVDLPREEYMGQGGEAPVRTASFAPVQAQYFRLQIDCLPVSIGQAKSQPGVQPFPFTPVGIDKVIVSEFSLFKGGKVHWAEHKAGFSIAQDYFSDRLVGPESQLSVNSATMIDVTAFLEHDGRLSWQPPAGNWRLFRFGYSLTGRQNGPAPDEATGLEVDKLDRKIVQHYLERHLNSFKFEFFPHSLLSDSIESGFQNWTDNFPEEFLNRRGYSVIKVLPAVAGWVVDSAEETDRMLSDFRLTISELLSESMYSTVSAYAASKGMTYYAEALEDKRPQLGDDLTMRSKANVPMGAMWMHDASEGSEQTYILDLLGAASVAHVYGKNRVGCEAFTAYARPFMSLPAQLKPVADLALSLGVTRFNIHTSPHQPDGVDAPGITMAPILGQYFSRHETWANLAKPWIEYLTVCSELLHQMAPASRVLYFVGEDAPVTSLWLDTEIDVPDGFPIDFISLDALQNKVTVAKDGKLLASDAKYDFLFLGGSSKRASLAYLIRLAELVGAGAKIVGNAPQLPLGLLDDCEEWKTLKKKLFDSTESPVVQATKLREYVASQVHQAELSPSWHFETKEGKKVTAGVSQISQIRCIQRTSENFDLYFIANATNETLDLIATFPVESNSILILNPVDSLKFTKLQHSNFQVGRTSTNFSLKGFESVFILLTRQPNHENIQTGNQLLDYQEIERSSWSLAGSTSSPYDTNPIFLTTEITIGEDSISPQGEEEFLFRLENFQGIAEVAVDGNAMGIIWAPNQSIDLGQISSGLHSFELRLYPTWRNRLVGMARGEVDSANHYIAWNPYMASAEPQFFDFSSAQLIRQLKSH